MLLLKSGRVIGFLEPMEVEPIAAILGGSRPDLVLPLVMAERRAIESAIILCEGNRRIAAMRLGISRTCLTDKLNSYRADDGEPPLPNLRGRIKHGRMAKAAGVGR